MKVRPASTEDLPAIVEIYNHAVLHGTATFDLQPTTVQERREWYARFGAEDPLLVCEHRETVAGYAYYLPYRAKPGYARTKEVTVYVHPEQRRQGVARALYRRLIDHARSRGVHVLVAVIADANPASVALHRGLGFVEAGTLREVGHKFGRWLDTAFWQLILTP